MLGFYPVFKTFVVFATNYINILIPLSLLLSGYTFGVKMKELKPNSRQTLGEVFGESLRNVETVDGRAESIFGDMG